MRCWFFHKFSKWTDFQAIMTRTRDGSKYEKQMQQRICEKCGIKQIRDIR